MPTVQQAPMANPALMQDPNYMQQMLQAQRQQRIAEALTQQGLEPIQYDKSGPISWTQGLAKMLNMYMGTRMGYDSDKSMANLQSQGMAMQLAQLGQGQEQPQQPTPEQMALALGAKQGDQAGAFDGNGTYVPPVKNVGPTVGNADLAASLRQAAPTQTPQIAGSVTPTAMNPYGLPPMLVMMARNGDPAAQKQLETLLQGQQLTDQQKNSRDSLIGGATVNNLVTQNMTEVQKLQAARKLVPDGSPQAQQLDAAIAKQNAREVKAGNLEMIGSQPTVFNPKVADGVAPIFQTNGGVTTPVGARALPGYAGANASIEGAAQGAKQANTIMTLPGQDNTPVTSWGGNFASTPGGFRGPNTNQQGDLQKRWSDLYGNASQAQAVINNLQQIKSYADKAQTGALSDRAQVADAILSMMGSKDASQRQIANNLLGKNASQITARLSQGNLSTDAARELISSAYPNAHMMADAIREAADNLIAQQHMTQAKAGLLLKHYMTGNPQQYQQAEMVFDQNADPRLFQWKGMPEGKAKDQYLSEILRQDPSLVQKSKNLEKMGIQ